MTREIKFRAYWPGDKKMEYWDEMLEVSENALRLYFVGENPILMQYIGRKDKNGTEIYEGDVICPHGDRHPDDCGVYHEHIEKPYYDKSAWHEQVKWDQKNALWNLPRDEDSNLSFPEFWIVIGNIWENPELIDK